MREESHVLAAWPPRWSQSLLRSVPTRPKGGWREALGNLSMWGGPQPDAAVGCRVARSTEIRRTRCKSQARSQAAIRFLRAGDTVRKITAPRFSRTQRFHRHQCNGLSVRSSGARRVPVSDRATVTPLSPPPATPASGANRRIRHHPPANSDSCPTG